MKKAIICTHGFRTGNYHDFDLFKKHMTKKHPSYDVFLISYYNPFDKKTIVSKDWYKRVLDQVKDIRKDYDQVTMIGYSMGGPYAMVPFSREEHIADNLVLISPTFNIGYKKIFGLLFKAAKNARKSNKRYKNLDIERYEKLKKKKFPLGILNQFTKLKKKKIWNETFGNWEHYSDARTLLIYDKDDELVSKKIIMDGIERMKCKNLTYKEYEGGGHLWPFISTFRKRFDDVIEWLENKNEQNK